MPARWHMDAGINGGSVNGSRGRLGGHEQATGEVGGGEEADRA